MIEQAAIQISYRIVPSDKKEEVIGTAFQMSLQKGRLHEKQQLKNYKIHNSICIVCCNSKNVQEQKVDLQGLNKSKSQEGSRSGCKKEKKHDPDLSM